MFEDNPGEEFGHEALGLAYRRAGLPDEETRAYRAEMEINGWDWVVTAMDQGMEAGGSREAWRRAAEALVDRFEETQLGARWIARFSRDAGEVEKVLDSLERALEQRDSNLLYIGLMDWNELYDRPRFQAVAEEIVVPLLGG